MPIVVALLVVIVIELGWIRIRLDKIIDAKHKHSPGTK
jgi:hypothetical protein